MTRFQEQLIAVQQFQARFIWDELLEPSIIRTRSTSTCEEPQTTSLWIENCWGNSLGLLYTQSVQKIHNWGHLKTFFLWNVVRFCNWAINFRVNTDMLSLFMTSIQTRITRILSEIVRGVAIQKKGDSSFAKQTSPNMRLLKIVFFNHRVVFQEMLIFWKHYVSKFKPIPYLLLSNMDQLLPKHSFNFMTLYNVITPINFCETDVIF